MRYPMLAFLFVFLLGPYTAHALLTGTARILPRDSQQVMQRSEQAPRQMRLSGGVLVSIREDRLRSGHGRLSLPAIRAASANPL